jgi:hypothetical protein
MSDQSQPGDIQSNPLETIDSEGVAKGQRQRGQRFRSRVVARRVLARARREILVTSLAGTSLMKHIKKHIGTALSGRSSPFRDTSGQPRHAMKSRPDAMARMRKGGTPW